MAEKANKDQQDPKPADNSENKKNNNGNNNGKKPFFQRPIVKWIGIGLGIGGAAYGGYKYGYKRGRASVQQPNPNINR